MNKYINIFIFCCFMPTSILLAQSDNFTARSHNDTIYIQSDSVVIKIAKMPGIKSYPYPQLTFTVINNSDSTILFPLASGSFYNKDRYAVIYSFQKSKY